MEKDFGTKCEKDSCQNGGFCAREGRICICPPEFHGTSCELKSSWKCGQDEDCRAPYSHWGTCYQPSGQCLCPSGRYGIRCEIPRSMGFSCTDSSQCKNGGVCSEGHCQCDSNWTGSFCEYRNPKGYRCSSPEVGRHDKCKFGDVAGSCNFYTGKCVCPISHFGLGSEVNQNLYGRNCQPTSCKNGGVCSIQTKKCICPAGWADSDCSVKSEFHCIDTADCQSVGTSAGVCEFGSGKCVCAFGFSGHKCEVKL